MCQTRSPFLELLLLFSLQGRLLRVESQRATLDLRRGYGAGIMVVHITAPLHLFRLYAYIYPDS